jgi:hypothetical protein
LFGCREKSEEYLSIHCTFFSMSTGMRWTSVSSILI